MPIGVYPRQPLTVRFWNQVTKNGPRYGRLGNCWVKPGSGEWYISAWGKFRRANRVSWELHYGKIPERMEVCHKCDNPACIRPTHLFLGTHKENMEDMSRKGRGSGGVSGVNNASVKHPELRQADRNGNRKLFSADVLVIRVRYRSGTETYKSLAVEYGVSVVTVNRVVNGRAWKSIKG